MIISIFNKKKRDMISSSNIIELWRTPRSIFKQSVPQSTTMAPAMIRTRVRRRLPNWNNFERALHQRLGHTL